MPRIVTLLLLLSIAFTAGAQDAGYWNNDYNPGGYVTPGAVIASDNDSGFFYYNPAVMALHPKTSVSVSANVYQYRNTRIRNAVGQGLPLRSREARIIPQLVSGTILLNRKNNLTIGYSLINRPILDFQATQRQDKKMNVLDDSYSPGPEYYIGQYSARNNQTQTIGSIGAGLKLNSHLAVGITAEGQLFNQDLYQHNTSRALYNTDTSIATPPVAAFQADYDLTYWHVGIRFKAGLAYEAGRHHFGLLLTTPMISVKGRAILNSDILISNVVLPQVGIAINVLANGRQTGLPVTYKMPLSIAAGYAFDYGRGQCYVVAEYFPKLSHYEIVSPRNESFLRPDTGSNNQRTQEFLEFSEERASVLNVGLGWSYELNTDITLLASLATNNTYIPRRPGDEEYAGQAPYTLNWNTYNCQLGGQFRRQRLHLRAGLLLTYGRTGQYLQPINFDTPTDENLLNGQQIRVAASTFAIGLMLSYIHNF
ncbi:hypothetical protein [Taibaiella koreensis]|uniref:hypothetical protein n=1 Tax=Taibaiella koreensis TaxID=1268548 RepID=UPI000E59D0BC|nr:hypothetical protein [Taibaiella koreensis]